MSDATTSPPLADLILMSVLLQGGKISDGTPMKILYVTYLIHDVNSYINLALMRFTYTYIIQVKFVNAYKALFMQKSLL